MKSKAKIPQKKIHLKAFLHLSERVKAPRQFNFAPSFNNQKKYAKEKNHAPNSPVYSLFSQSSSTI
jgi:hypothetical protein